MRAHSQTVAYATNLPFQMLRKVRIKDSDAPASGVLARDELSAWHDYELKENDFSVAP